MNTNTVRTLNVTHGKNIYLSIKKERFQDYNANFLMVYTGKYLSLSLMVYDFYPLRCDDFFECKE